ncbi:MAG: RecQ family ATP-dependent DNA helicase [Chitinophagales bacterium]|nr:ATP-dependent DNA helicase [Sphingobacteriales bacterium]
MAPNSISQSRLSELLQKNFGFNTFKGEQEKIIESILSGRDSFVLMPTGGGKSLCYQLPGIISEGTAVIISPLIALMKNQVDLVRNYNENENVAHFYNSTLNVGQKRAVEKEVIEGRTKLLYIAPETLAKPDNIEFLKAFKISFVAIDEAHCISEWGHDFRPEYRKIKDAIKKIPYKVPIMALTATATPKVQTDIVKNLGLKEHNLFVSSFNRPNLYYEIRYKINDDWAVKNIIQYIKNQEGKSGIIYVLNRKSAEKIAETLCLNGIKAAPYHAGLEAKLRANTQDEFLAEDIHVIVATVAFGMGIDKPDIRFVIHYNIAKSLENYYQETGRAGRDGLEGNCIAYFNYKDIHKVEKMLSDKTVTERERGMLLIDETVAYIESGECRRKYLLNYFGEEYDSKICTESQMCDNCVNPKEKVDVTEDISLSLNIINSSLESHYLPHIMNIAMGIKSDGVLSYKHDQMPFFGKGSDKNEHYWTSVLRTTIIHGLVYREVEEYGTLKLTKKGFDYIKKTYPIHISLNHNYETEGDIVLAGNNTSTMDKELYNILLDVRKIEAKKANKPPYVIIQAPSLEEMCLKYPINEEEFGNITGVTKAMAAKYAKCFCTVIADYVEENDIMRPDDVMVKTIVNKSNDKVKIIAAIDKKISLETISKELGLKFTNLVDELESIVLNGTKLNIRYYLKEILDDEVIDEMMEFFQKNETGDIKECYENFLDDDLPEDDIRLVKLQFIGENLM